jgi:1-acyl-sn-glycerol-3-phosphate acyltransferase
MSECLDKIQGKACQLVLVSSCAIYGPDHRSNEYHDESHKRRPSLSNRESIWWDQIESVVKTKTRECTLSILRIPVATFGLPHRFFDQIIRRRLVFKPFGFDPLLQVLDISELARAINAITETGNEGIWNVCSTEGVSTTKLFRFLGVRAIPIPYSLQCLLRPGCLRPFDGVKHPHQIDFLRYPSTASVKRFEATAGFQISSRDILQRAQPDSDKAIPVSDPFGHDEQLDRQLKATVFPFFEKVYWRIEHRGMEHIPKSGACILAGPHRGFMPLDAIMLFHLITRHKKRVPRFLIHPTLVKFPLQSIIFRRLASIPACEKNADWILENEQILGIYPEGIQGTFKLYRDAYDIGDFRWKNYIIWAIKHEVPIIPFASVGSAEIYPILYRVQWARFKRYMEWPCLPITPTFPFFPLPLPSKWHFEILPPVDAASENKKALSRGEDPIKAISAIMRDRIQASTDRMRKNRSTAFWGSAFK